MKFQGYAWITVGIMDGSANIHEETGQSLKIPGEDPESAIPVLVIVDERTVCVFSGVVAKRCEPLCNHLVTEALKFLGRHKVVLFTDSEHSIKALAEAVGKEYKGEVQLMNAPRESHASNGLAERAVLEIAKQCRALVSAIESKFKGFKLLPSEKHFPWLAGSTSSCMVDHKIPDET